MEEYLIRGYGYHCHDHHDHLLRDHLTVNKVHGTHLYELTLSMAVHREDQLHAQNEASRMAGELNLVRVVVYGREGLK